jgi:CHAT domain-containing protein
MRQTPGILPLLLVTATALLPATGNAADAAAAFKNVGDEIPIGINATGERCRLRMVGNRGDRQAYQRFVVLCDGWRAPSGEIQRFNTGPNYPLEKLLTDSGAQRWLAARVDACDAVEHTTLRDGSPAALRACRRIEGGWRVVVLATNAGRQSYVVETFPTNLPVLEAALEFFKGQRSSEQLESREGTISAAIRRTQALLDAGGLTSIRDVGLRGELYALGRRQDWSGNWAASELTWRRLLELEERVFGVGHAETGHTMSWIAHELARLGRFQESDVMIARAEPLIRQSLSRWAWPHHLSLRSINERVRGQHDAAIRFGEEAVRAYESGTKAENGVAEALTQTARAYCAVQREDDCERAYLRALPLIDTPGPDPEFRVWRVGEIRNDLGVLYLRRRKFAEARQHLEAALERRRQVMGDGFGVSFTLRALGRLAMAEQRLPDAIDAWRGAAQIIARDPIARDTARPDNIEGYLEALVQAAAARPEERDALMAEAFTAIQLPREGETAKAITTMSARLSSADPALQKILRDYQDAVRERDRTRSAVAAELYREANDRDSDREANLKNRLQEAIARAEGLEQAVQAQFPRYMKLTGAGGVSAADPAKWLRPGEAILAFMSTRDVTWVVLLRDGVATVHRAGLSRAALESAVKAIRKSVELSDGPPPAFAVAEAHRLWNDLLAPLGTRLDGISHLIVVPSGPLQSLPLGLLLTAPMTERDSLRQAPWLARRMAISVVPSVASLRDLRATVARSSAPRPFYGFGDPLFSGPPADTRALLRATDVCRDGPLSDAEVVRSLPRLRETATELRGIAASLGGGADAVVLGAAATESAVKRADLKQYRVLALATHGLLAADLRCKNEPALALTAPATPSELDDGLLDASEVAQLALDADWVVLSACNTAAPDGRLTGEALSGLARGFFYAGARSLLVTHWAVASAPTVTLTTTLFRAYAADPALGRAEALRRAQRALMDKPETAHPAFWAPFIVAGDGG